MGGVERSNVLAFVGPAGCGKDTAAKFVMAEHPMAFNLKFAGALKDLSSLLFGWDRVRLDEDLEYKEAEAFWPDGTPVSTYPGGKMSKLHGRVRTRREILQLVGTDMFRQQLDKNVWLQAASASIPAGVPLIVATDIRFDNEIEFLRNQGHAVYCVKLGRRRAKQGTEASGHVSELGISESLVDGHALIDDGDFDVLRSEALRAAGVALRS